MCLYAEKNFDKDWKGLGKWTLVKKIQSTDSPVFKKETKEEVKPVTPIISNEARLLANSCTMQ